MTYKPEDRALAVAAVERYGWAAGQLMLESVFGMKPAKASLSNWMKTGENVPDEGVYKRLDKVEEQRKKRLQGLIDQRMEPALHVFDRAMKDDRTLGMQQCAMSIGILYDKLVPPPKAGGGLVNVAGDGTVVQLMVVAPASDGEHRALPVAERYVEGRVVEKSDE